MSSRSKAPRPAPGSPLAQLLAGPMAAGRLMWIGLRPARREPLLAVPRGELVAGSGLQGDHFRSRANGARQVTLIAHEHLVAVAAFLGLPSVSPLQLRRNLVTEGINLLALKGRRFRIGNALLEWSGECHPCSRMNETLGERGYNAVRGHGGVTARVLEGGQIELGDAIERLEAAGAVDLRA